MDPKFEVYACSTKAGVGQRGVPARTSLHIGRAWHHVPRTAPVASYSTAGGRVRGHTGPPARRRRTATISRVAVPIAAHSRSSLLRGWQRRWPRDVTPLRRNHPPHAPAGLSGRRAGGVEQVRQGPSIIVQVAVSLHHRPLCMYAPCQFPAGAGGGAGQQRGLQGTRPAAGSAAATRAGAPSSAAR